MAPELGTQTPEDSTISASKPPKVKATVPEGKRKAVGDASPIARKKSKSTKNVRRTKPSEPSLTAATTRETKYDTHEEEEEEEEEEEKLLDEEGGQVQALAKLVDSDEDDIVKNGTPTYHQGQDVGRAPEISKELKKLYKSGGTEPGVVYVGRIPHGFYEKQMEAYFSQFGKVNKIRMSRNKATGASKHFAFVEFAETGVAEIVAKTMDNYLLWGHILKVKVVPKSQIHENLWKGANRRFKKVPWNRLVGNRLKKPLSTSAWARKISNEERKRAERAKKLQDIGYEFEAPQLKIVNGIAEDVSVLEDVSGEAPKTTEVAIADPAVAAPPDGRGRRCRGKRRACRRGALCREVEQEQGADGGDKA